MTRNNDALLEAMVSLNAELDLPRVLDRFLAASTGLTAARYAAINVVDAAGISIDFRYVGMDAGVWSQIGRAPNAVGTLGAIPLTGTLLIPELTEHPSFKGLPPGHPPLGSFLGVALTVRDKVYGYLYLAGKHGGFSGSDERIVIALGAAASVAIDHAQLYARALARDVTSKAGRKAAASALAQTPRKKKAKKKKEKEKEKAAVQKKAAELRAGIEDL